MRRWMMLGGAALLAVSAIFAWMSAEPVGALPPPPPAEARAAPLDPPAAPVLPPKDREANRLARYDRDKDGAVSRAEYLQSRERAFGKLDTNRDGRLDFEEYTARAAAKFTGADSDGNGRLSPQEFATTAVKRKAKARPACPPSAADDG